MQPVRYLKPTLVGLVGGLLLTITAAAVEFLIASQRLAASVQCVGAIASVCDGAVQFGDVRDLGIMFVVAFAGAFIWFGRRQRRRVA